MDKFKVRIGNDVFTVEAEDNFRAKYEAAVRFKDKHNLSNPLGEIVSHAKARVVPSLEPEETTAKVLEELRRS